MLKHECPKDECGIATNAQRANVLKHECSGAANARWANLRAGVSIRLYVF